MEILNKTDRFIFLIENIILSINPTSLFNEYFDLDKERRICFIKKFKWLLQYKLMPMYQIPDNLDNLDDFIFKHRIEEKYKKTVKKILTSNEPNIKDVENEFWKACPIDCMPQYMQIYRVKFNNILSIVPDRVDHLNFIHNENDYTIETKKLTYNGFLTENESFSILSDISNIISSLNDICDELSSYFNKIKCMVESSQSEQYITDKSIDNEDIQKIKKLCTDDVNEYDIKLFLKHGSASKKLSSYNKKGVTAKKLCDCLLPMIDCGKFPQIKMQSSQKEKTIFISNNFDYGFDSLKNNVTDYYKLKKDN